MEYKKIERKNYNLNIIKTDRFKTLTFRIYFRNKIKKEEITLRNMLTRFLVYSTDTYPTKRDIIFKCQDLYAAEVYTSSNMAGSKNVISFTLSILNEKYTEKGMLEESIKFLSDVIYHPNFNNDDLYNAAYTFLYNQYERNITGYKEHKSSYSIMRMYEEMNDNKPYNYREIGYLEDLKKLNKKKLVDYYNKILNDSIVDVYVIGDVSLDIADLIDKYFTFNEVKNRKFDCIIEHSKLPEKIRVVKEKDDNSQSKLAIACKIKKLTDFERNYVANIYNLILGGSSESKFFQIIREKNSLAYYANSSINKLDNIMVIKAGISKRNYNKVIRLIKKLMKDMTLGKFSEEDIKVAKENYISMLNEIEDNPEAIIDTYTAVEIFGLGDIEARKEEILKVEKSDIVKFSKKVGIDIIYLLEGIGEDHEEN